MNDSPRTLDDGEVGSLAARLRTALAQGRSVPRPLVDGTLSVDDAYRVSAAIARLRIGDGDQRVGRKFGFTNRSIWPLYGVDTAMVGDMYATSVMQTDGTGSVALGGLAEPRLEPEIVLGLAAAPHGGVDDLAAAVGWVAIGVEVVQSVFRDWRFDAAETIAAGGLHGRLVIGPQVKAGDAGFDALVKDLADVELVAACDGREIGRGTGRNALDGPLSALSHAVEILARQADHPSIAAGECVTTGTVTDAFPVAPGERWTVSSTHDRLPALTVDFTP